MALSFIDIVPLRRVILFDGTNGQEIVDTLNKEFLTFDGTNINVGAPYWPTVVPPGSYVEATGVCWMTQDAAIFPPVTPPSP